MPFIKGGKMKALMLTASKPASQLPDVPFGAKVGIPLEVTSWQALAAPDVKERMGSQAFDIVANSPTSAIS